MAVYHGSAAADVFIGGNDDDIVTGIGQGLDIISTGGGNDTVTIVPDSGGLLDLLPDIINMGTGNDDHLIIDSRTASRPVSMSIPVLELAQGLLGVLSLGGLERLNYTGVDRFTVYGGTANDVITTGNGNDTINGGRGADRMAGGSGADRYYVDNVGDVVTEFAGGGDDLVYATISYRLPDYVEALVLRGDRNISATGNALNNTLIGNSGDNRLDGGAGTDIMRGAGGNDTYIVDAPSDRVFELEGEGVDTVLSSVTFKLSPFVENLTLTGNRAANAIGNAQNNVLTGNASANRLDGGGGVDTLVGGAGNDVYVVDRYADSVVEKANEGADTVVSSVNWTLGANLEILRLAGTANLVGRGNDLDNSIFGNSGANVIYGGLGRDVLYGGAGSDRFDFDSVAESSFAAPDAIMDLSMNDIIDLSDIDANANAAGNQAFTLVSAFTKTAGQLRVVYDHTSNVTTVFGDVNGDGVADLRIRIAGEHSDFTGFVY